MTAQPAARSWNDFPILGPYSIAISNLTTASAQVLAADNARTGIIFHNPGSKNKRVLPAGTTAADLVTAATQLIGGTGGILIYPQSEFMLIQGEDTQYNTNCAWIAVTDDNTDGALTILNFTPNTPGAPLVQMTMRKLQDIPVTSPTATPTTTLGTGSVQVLAADPNRSGVLFANPGTNVAAVCPSNLAASIGAGSIIILPGDSKRIIGNDRVRINCAWNGIAQSGANNALTALSLYG